MAASLGRLTLDLLVNLGTFEQGLNRAEREVRDTTRDMSGRFDAVSSSVRNMIGAMAGIASVGTLIGKMDAYTGLQNRLKLVTTSQAELNKSMQDTFAIAQATGAAWDSTAMVYQRFAQNAERLNISMAKTASLTETVSKAIAISGGSAASAEAALMQFGQALASGVLRGEEFNSISEQAPGLLNAIAEGLQVNIGQLRAMAGEGKLTAEVVIESLEKAKLSVDDLFSKTDFTIGNSFTMLNNAVTQFIGEAGKGSGAATVFTESIQLIAHNFDTLVNVGLAATAFWAGKYLPVIGASIDASVGRVAALHTEINASRAAAAQELINTQAKLASVQAARVQIIEELKLELQRKKSQISTQGAINSELRMGLLRRQQAAINAQLTATENALAAARARATAAGGILSTTGRGALAVLGGPVGLGVLVATAAASYLLLRDNTAEANKELARNAEYANLAKEELEKLTGAQKRAAIDGLEKALEAQNKELKAANSSFNSAAIQIQNYTIQNQLGYEAQLKVRNITNDVLRGIISQEVAIKRFNALDFVTPAQIKRLGDTNRTYEEQRIIAQKTSDALGVYGKQTELTGNAASNAEGKQRALAQGIDEVEGSAKAATKALTDYLDKLNKSALIDLNITGFIEQGYSPSQAKVIADLWNSVDSNTIITQEQIEKALNSLSITERRAEAEKQYADRIKAREQTIKDANKASEDALKKAKDLDKQQRDMGNNLVYSLSSEAQKIRLDYLKLVEDINFAKFEDPNAKAKYLKQVKDQYEIDKAYFNDSAKLRATQLEYDLYSWRMNENEKLDFLTQIEDVRIQISKEYSDIEKKIRLTALKEQYDFEINQIRRAEQERFDSLHRTSAERLSAAQTSRLDSLAQLVMIPSELKYWQMQNSMSSAMGGAYTDYQGSVDNINKQTNGQFDISSEEDRNELLLSAERAYQEQRLAIQQEYALHERNLRDSEYQSQLDVWGQMTSQAQSTWGMMTQAVKDANGEQSSAYKNMFAMQQAFAIASAIISTEQAAAKALELGPILGIPASTLVRTMGYANVAMIAAQTIASFADGGFTGAGGKYEPAGIVHKGEVVFSQTDVARLGGVGNVEALRKGGYGFADGGVVGTKVLDMTNNPELTKHLDNRQKAYEANITINNNSSANVTARQGMDGRVYVTIDEVEDFVSNSLSRANSKISKSVQQNTNAGRRR